jgi:putative CocE/NonD family hydrolase
MDVRGTGGSGGTTADTNDPGEALDGAETVEWAAAQSWCDGSVGIWGMSYGGGMSWRVAALQPPHLKAVCATFAGPNPWDNSYPGGCPMCLRKFARESWMLALDLAPPTYQDPEGRWYRVWRERLDRLDGEGIYSGRMGAHQQYDDFWRARTPDLSAIKVPTLAMSSWRDTNPEGVVQGFAALECTKRLIMGPWLHESPDLASQEPIEWLFELTRWWDRWLRGLDNGVDKEPQVMFFVQGAGRWRAENEWPVARATPQSYYLATGEALDVNPQGTGGSDVYDTDATVGSRSGGWDALGLGVDYPVDQGPDDRRSLTYTSGPLSDDIEITGSPSAVLFVSSNGGEDFYLVAKLVTIAPDGAANLITTGWLRAELRDSQERAEPLEPQRAYELRLGLRATSYLVPKGHRLRVSVACADFPFIWPTATNPSITLHTGGDTPSRVILPSVPARTEPLPEPVVHPADPTADHAPWDADGGGEMKITDDVSNGTTTVMLSGFQDLRLPQGGRFYVTHSASAAVSPARPDGARVEGTSGMRIRMPAGELIEVETQSIFFKYRLACSGKVTINGRPFYERTWTNF